MTKERAIIENLLNEYGKQYELSKQNSRTAYHEGATAAYHACHRDSIKAKAALEVLERLAKACDLKVRFNETTGNYTVEKK